MTLRGAEDVGTAEATAQLAVAVLVARDAPAPEVFAAAAEQSAALLGVEAAAAVRFVGAERAVVVGAWRAAGVRGLPVNAELDFGRASSALGLVRATRRPARMDGYEGARGELPVVMRSIGLRTSAAAPILVDDDVWGALVVSTAVEERLPPGSEARLTTLAELVAHGLRRALARERATASRRRIVEAGDEARRRLEHVLHEGAQQHLVSLALKVRVARAQAPPELVGLLDEALAEAVETGVELGDLARALHPAVLSERGLAAALQALAARSPAPVHLRELPGRRFATAVERTSYLLVSEALENCMAHAGASEVLVLVMDDGDRLVVEIRDDGTGGAAVRSGASLEALRDRVQALGGTFTLDSPAGRGTILRAAFAV